MTEILNPSSEHKISLRKGQFVRLFYAFGLLQRVINTNSCIHFAHKSFTLQVTRTPFMRRCAIVRE